MPTPAHSTSPTNPISLLRGRVTTATAVAGLLGAPLAAGLMSLDGVAGLAGWRWLFLAEGLAPLLLAAALPLLLPASPLTAGFLSPAQREWLWQRVHVEAEVELIESPTADAPAGPPETAPEPADAATAAEAAARRPLLRHLSSQPDSPAAAADAKAQHPASGPHSGSSGGLSWAAVQVGLLDRRIWHLSAAMLLIDACMNAANFWLPMIVRAVLDGHLGSSGSGNDSSDEPPGPSTQSLNIKASLLSALPFCAAAVAMVANAHHARLKDERRLHVALPMLCTALALGAMPALAALGPAPALLGLSAAAAGIWSVHGPFFR